jgi:hypothetical protein
MLNIIQRNIKYFAAQSAPRASSAGPPRLRPPDSSTLAHAALEWFPSTLPYQDSAHSPPPREIREDRTQVYAWWTGWLSWSNVPPLPGTDVESFWNRFSPRKLASSANFSRHVPRRKRDPFTRYRSHRCGITRNF